MDENSRRTKYIAINRIVLLYVKIRSKCSALGIKESSGDERGSLCFSPMIGW